MEGMGFARLTFVVTVLASAWVVGCSDGAQPPIIGDGDGGGIIVQDDGGGIVPCSEPQATCPCNDAGAQVQCGTVYRVSGSHVDCSPAYLTCQEDGTWSSCVGPSVYDGG
jgi:hypothetical protein